MYEDWHFERWETPVSNCKNLRTITLVYCVVLSIIISDTPDSEWKFRFEHAPIYQSIPETYRLELWELGKDNPDLGSTVIIPDSPWLAQLRKHEVLIDVDDPGLIHFQIRTENDIFDILASKEPEITTITTESQKLWSEKVASLGVDILVDAGLVTQENFNLATEIVAEEIHVRLMFNDYPY